MAHPAPLARRPGRHPVFTLALACALAGATAWAQETIEIREGLIVGRVGEAGRAPFFTDPVALAYARGERVRPEEGDRLTLGDREAEWKAGAAGDDGWFRGREMSGGHLFATVESGRERVMLLEARGDSVVYVNDELRAGDPYGNGLLRIPVVLREGTNTLLFRGARGELRASLVEPEAPIAFDTGDFTLPDQIEGEGGDLWAGVPILNATTEDAGGLTVRASARGAGSGAETAVETGGIGVPRLSVYKAPVRLPRGEADAEGKIAVTLEIVRGGEVLHRKDVSLRARAPGDKHVRTFVSGIDGSVQYFAVTPMHAAESGGAQRPALFLTLHGASVEGQGQANAYGFKDWGYIVAPTNRRPFGFDWEDWGRLDAVEVLDAASALFDADPDRTYLTGHSMGGHGTWQLGAQFPGRFAAIGPSAGWISFWSYGGLIEYGTETPVREAFTRAASPSDTLALSENYAGLGVYILHGDADDNVPVDQARQMRARLAEFHGNYAYYERPGAGHWWGDACVDWEPMFEFFRANRRPERPDHLRFVTASPGVSAEYRWASVLEQTEPMKRSRIDLSLDAAGGRIEGTTENVARLALRLGETQRSVERSGAEGAKSEALAPAAGEALTIVLDGESLSVVPETLEQPLYLSRVNGAWGLDAGARPERKGPHRYGPFKAAFAGRAVLVYATGGDEAENAWAFGKARFDAETFKYRGNGAFQVVSDEEFLAAPRGSTLADPGRNVVLYGNASTNKAWSAVLDGGGLTLTREGATIGGASYPGGDFGVLAVRPRAGSESALVGIVGGTTPAGCRATDRLPCFLSGAAYPDFTVLSPEVYSAGIDGVLAAGYFGGDWTAPGAPAPAQGEAPGSALVRVERVAATSGGAEIVAYDHVRSRLYATHARGVDVYEVSPEGRLTGEGSIDCTAFVPGLASASSVAIDPAGRGLGAVTLIPEAKDTIPGVLALFETGTARVIATFAVGYSPDMVCFSPDGGRVLVADEGEPGGTDPAGAISVLDLSGVRRPADAARLGPGRVTTTDFSPANMGSDVSFDGVRIAPERREEPWLDLEPESIAPDLEGAWVSLQENNALARFDFQSGRWTRLLPLGSLAQTLDASDRDGGMHIDDTVAGLPMPDSIASYAADGGRYLVTVNEGDGREGDEARLAEARLDPVAFAMLLARYGDPRADSALGRLLISTRDGDTDGDGDIDIPTTLGSRSFSILDARTGERVWDSGSSLELFTGVLAPGLFNSEGRPDTFDTRSDDRGPEPEGLAIARIGEREYAFVGLERTGGVAMFDVTEPGAPRFIEYAIPDDAAEAGVGPEGLAVVKRGEAVFLAVAYEVSGTIEVFRVRAPGAP